MASMNTLRKAALAVVGLATFGFAFGSAFTPVAEAHATPVAQAYVTVAWEMPKAPVNLTSPTWPQKYYLSTKTKTPMLNALDSSLKCNVPYQVDVYVDNDITKALIVGKHLDGPNNPKEALVPGGWGTAYKLVYVKCTTPTPTTPTSTKPVPTTTKPTTTTPVPTTTKPTTTTPVPTTTKPVPSTTTPVPTTTTPTSTITTKVPVPSATPPILTARTLADTGAPSMMGWSIIFGLVALGAGSGILFLKKYKAEDVDTESDN